MKKTIKLAVAKMFAFCAAFMAIGCGESSDGENNLKEVFDQKNYESYSISFIVNDYGYKNVMKYDAGKIMWFDGNEMYFEPANVFGWFYYWSNFDSDTLKDVWYKNLAESDDYYLEKLYSGFLTFPIKALAAKTLKSLPNAANIK